MFCDCGHLHADIIFVIFSPDVREFFSLDNPKNAETTDDDDDQPGADESDTQVTYQVHSNLFAAATLESLFGKMCILYVPSLNFNSRLILQFHEVHVSLLEFYALPGCPWGGRFERIDCSVKELLVWSHFPLHSVPSTTSNTHPPSFPLPLPLSHPPLRTPFHLHVQLTLLRQTMDINYYWLFLAKFHLFICNQTLYNADPSPRQTSKAGSKDGWLRQSSL